MSSPALRPRGEVRPWEIAPIAPPPLQPPDPLPALPARELTPRQAEVLRHLASGCSTDQIAARLGISVETVRNHIRDLLKRLGVHSRLEAVVEGRRRGLV